MASVESSTAQKWSSLARRRWPLTAAILAILIISALAIAKTGGTKAASGETSEKQESGKAVMDTVVTLDSTSLRLADIEIVPVAPLGSGGLLANGTITYDANRASVVAPRAEGRVSAVRADLGDEVRTGAVLALLESPDVGQTRGDVERARATLEVARDNSEREKRLYEQRISSQKEMLEAQGAYKIAQAEFNSAAARISGLGAGSGRGGVYGLVSPVSGTVVERNAMPGQVVGPSSNLFTVADLRHLWINADVYESDIGRVVRGAPAIVRPRSLPNEEFRGRVTFARGVVDTSSRTVKVRVEVDNSGLRLRPGMFAQIKIETAAPGTGKQQQDSGALVVPELAVQELNGRQVVFIPSGAGRFSARTITVGKRLGRGMVSVFAGLRSGESVVSKGAFQLKAELIKGTFGEDED